MQKSLIEKRARRVDQLAVCLAQIATQLPDERPNQGAEDCYLLQLTKLNDRADILWDKSTVLIGSWAQVRSTLPFALQQLLPVQKGERIGIRIHQGRDVIAQKVQETLRQEEQYQAEKAAISNN
jgi:hypothetical protein